MLDKVDRKYEAFIDDISCVHDGDTLEGCVIRVPGVTAQAGTAGELFPEMFVDASGAVCIHTAVRLADIDAPELHPRHRLPNRTLRSSEEIAHERRMAVQARQVLVDALTAAGLKFEIRNPQLGKYAGKIVGSVFVLDKASGEQVDLSQRLLDLKLARPYFGGTKERWTLAVGWSTCGMWWTSIR